MIKFGEKYISCFIVEYGTRKIDFFIPLQSNTLKLGPHKWDRKIYYNP